MCNDGNAVFLNGLNEGLCILGHGRAPVPRGIMESGDHDVQIMQKLLRHIQIAPCVGDVCFHAHEHSDSRHLTQRILPVQILEVVKLRPISARRSMIGNGQICQAAFACRRYDLLQRGKRMPREDRVNVKIPDRCSLIVDFQHPF